MMCRQLPPGRDADGRPAHWLPGVMPGKAVSLRRWPATRGARNVVSSVLPVPCSNLAIQQCFLHLANGARHVDAARAGFHAVKDRAATPHALERIQNLHAL